MANRLSYRPDLPAPAFRARVPGVAAASLPYRQMKRRLVLVVVVAPLLGLLAALVLLWRYSAGPTEVGLLVGMYALTILGVSIGFHRHFAHRSFQAGTGMRAVFIILGSMAVQGPVLTWAAVHRRHHQYSDQQGDPHSPYSYSDGRSIGGMFRGFWHSHVGWLFEPEVTDWGQYVPDLLRDRLIFKLSRFYLLWVILGLVAPAAVGGLVSGTWFGLLNGFLWGGLARLFLVHHASWTIGSICHIYGSRPFETEDESTNNAWLAIPTVGDSWHNNHHAFPVSALHGLKWWQVDLAGWVIRALEACGLIWKVERPSSQKIDARRRQERRAKKG